MKVQFCISSDAVCVKAQAAILGHQISCMKHEIVLECNSLDLLLVVIQISYNQWLNDWSVQYSKSGCTVALPHIAYAHSLTLCSLLI